MIFCKCRWGRHVIWLAKEVLLTDRMLHVCTYLTNFYLWSWWMRSQLVVFEGWFSLLPGVIVQIHFYLHFLALHWIQIKWHWPYMFSIGQELCHVLVWSMLVNKQFWRPWIQRLLRVFLLWILPSSSLMFMLKKPLSSIINLVLIPVHSLISWSWDSWNSPCWVTLCLNSGYQHKHERVIASSIQI